MTQKKLLLITWDSETSNYLETLFFPILSGLGMECHVMQFSWANPVEVSRIQALAKGFGVNYKHVPVSRKPHPAIGAIWTVYRGKGLIRSYIQKHAINVLMPRSIMPAMMVNRLKNWLKGRQVQLVYDADGLSIEERVDFAGLQPGSYRYRKQKGEELEMLLQADLVLTRSNKAIQFLLEGNQELTPHKFFKVSNGRDPNHFVPDLQKRMHYRNLWGLQENDILLAYTGSIGVPYKWERMLEIFTWLHREAPGSKFLVLTRSQLQIPAALTDVVIVIQGAFADIPGYLSAADIGISLRKSAPSLIGLAPIKIGEYFLMGLPVLLSAGIGDTEALLSGISFAQYEEDLNKEQLMQWVKESLAIPKNEIRDFGIRHFNLQQTIAGYKEILNA